MTIVGIVGDIRDSPGLAPGGELFMPLAQHPSRAGLVHAVIRTHVAPEALTTAIAKYPDSQLLQKTQAAVAALSAGAR